MEKKDIPQYEDSKLKSMTREVVYAKDKEGQYSAELSKGWDVKSLALDHAWDGINERITSAKDKVLKGEVSPVLFYMELRLMDLPVLAGYTKFRKWQIKRHMKPAVFAKLNTLKLTRYTEAFDITLEQLKNIELYSEE